MFEIQKELTSKVTQLETELHLRNQQYVNNCNAIFSRLNAVQRIEFIFNLGYFGDPNG